MSRPHQQGLRGSGSQIEAVSMSEKTQWTERREKKSVGLTGIKVVSVAVDCLRFGLILFWATLGTAWLYVVMGQWFVKTLGLNGWFGWIFYTACFGILFLGMIAASLVSAILIVAVKVTGTDLGLPHIRSLGRSA